MWLIVFTIFFMGNLIEENEANRMQGAFFSQAQTSLNTKAFVEVHSEVKSLLRCAEYCLSNMPCFGVSYRKESKQCQLLFQSETTNSALIEIKDMDVWLRKYECLQPPETEGIMKNIYVDSDESAYINSTCLHTTLSSVNHELRFCQANGSWEDIKELKCGKKFFQYKVKVFTGDVSLGGSDARVYIQLFGELGDSGERQLDDENDNFEQGMEEEFILESPNLGTLQRLHIRHDNANPEPGWFLDKIIVEDMDTNQVYNFPNNQWLAVHVGAISANLYPAD